MGLDISGHGATQDPFYSLPNKMEVNKNETSKDEEESTPVKEVNKSIQKVAQKSLKLSSDNAVQSKNDGELPFQAKLQEKNMLHPKETDEIASLPEGQNEDVDLESLSDDELIEFLQAQEGVAVIQNEQLEDSKKELRKNEQALESSDINIANAQRQVVEQTLQKAQYHPVLKEEGENLIDAIRVVFANLRNNNVVNQYIKDGYHLDVQGRIFSFDENIDEQVFSIIQDHESIKNFIDNPPKLVKVTDGRAHIISDESDHSYTHGQKYSFTISGNTVEAEAHLIPMSSELRQVLQEIHAPLIAVLKQIITRLQAAREETQQQKATTMAQPQQSVTVSTASRTEHEPTEKLKKNVNEWLKLLAIDAAAASISANIREKNERMLEDFRKQLESARDIDREAIKKEIQRQEILHKQENAVTLEKPEALSFYNLYVQRMYELLEAASHKTESSY